MYRKLDKILTVGKQLLLVALDEVFERGQETGRIGIKFTGCHVSGFISLKYRSAVLI